MLLEIRCSSLDKVLRMLEYPRRIRSDMVGHKIEQQAQATFGEFAASRCQTLRAAQMLVDHIAPHAVSGTNIVLGAKIGKSSTEIVQETGVVVGNGNAGRASLPHAHEPNCVESVLSNGIPFRGWYGGQVNR